MHTSIRGWMRTAPIAVIIALAVPAISHPTPAQPPQDVPEKIAEAIREHIDEAEDIVESLLDWRLTTFAVRTGDKDAPPPTSPATTLISVDRAPVQRLSALLDAAAAMLPERTTTTTTVPRGDLRAHIVKAQEIVRELLPSDTAKPTGTTGGIADDVQVDRAALQRLEIEIDAMELVAPRRLK